MLIYWSEEAISHIRTRSERYPGSVDIDPIWTSEVLDDPDALWFEPDPKSVSGLGIRIIGYSIGARFVVTVIGYRRDGRLRGATAFKASGSDLRAYREGLMNAEIERLVRDEAEATREAELPVGGGKRANRGRSTVYSVRLTDEEVAAVQVAAERAHLPASTLVRAWIIERARFESADDGDARLRAMIHEEVRAAVREALAS